MLPLAAAAQSSLPPGPRDTRADSSNCVGTYTQVDTVNLPAEFFFKRLANDFYAASKGKQEHWVEGNIRGEFTFNQR